MLEGTDWKTHKNYIIVFGGRAHKILTRLVFRSFETEISKNNVGSLHGLAAVVEDSAEFNYSQLTGNVDGTTIVPTFDWTSFFAPHFKRILGIKKVSSLFFSSQ